MTEVEFNSFHLIGRIKPREVGNGSGSYEQGFELFQSKLGKTTHQNIYGMPESTLNLSNTKKRLLSNENGTRTGSSTDQEFSNGKKCRHSDIFHSSEQNVGRIISKDDENESCALSESDKSRQLVLLQVPRNHSNVFRKRHNSLPSLTVIPPPLVRVRSSVLSSRSFVSNSSRKLKSCSDERSMHCEGKNSTMFIPDVLFHCQRLVPTITQNGKDLETYIIPIPGEDQDQSLFLAEDHTMNFSAHSNSLKSDNKIFVPSDQDNQTSDFQSGCDGWGWDMLECLPLNCGVVEY